jgi:molecular chaperone HtpG
MAKKQFKSESKRLSTSWSTPFTRTRKFFCAKSFPTHPTPSTSSCYISLTDDKVGLTRDDFKIELGVNREKRTLTVSDNGIGMTKEELDPTSASIARSGSEKFKRELGDERREDIDIIGQFGVGFYSAFMVALDRHGRHPGVRRGRGYKWVSSGSDGYSITQPKNSLSGRTSS